KPVNLIASNLPASLAQDEIQNVQRQLNICGLHAMRLDLREDSSRLNATLDETLRALGIASDFAEMPDQKRLALLSRLLESELPSLSKEPGITPATAET